MHSLTTKKCRDVRWTIVRCEVYFVQKIDIFSCFKWITSISDKSIVFLDAIQGCSIDKQNTNSDSCAYALRVYTTYDAYVSCWHFVRSLKAWCQFIFLSGFGHCRAFLTALHTSSREPLSHTDTPHTRWCEWNKIMKKICSVPIKKIYR